MSSKRFRLGRRCTLQAVIIAFLHLVVVHATFLSDRSRGTTRNDRLAKGEKTVTFKTVTCDMFSPRGEGATIGPHGSALLVVSHESETDVNRYHYHHYARRRR